MHTVKTGKLSVLPQVPQGRNIRPKEKSWGTEWRSHEAPPSSIKYAPFRSSRKHLWTSLNMLPGKRTAGVSLAAHQAQELVAVAGLGKVLQQRPRVERLGNGLHPARARPPAAARASFPPPRAWALPRTLASRFTPSPASRGPAALSAASPLAGGRAAHARPSVRPKHSAGTKSR